MAPQKVQLAQRVQSNATAIARALEEATRIVAIYSARGYDAKGANPIIADDLEGHEITPKQISAFVTFITALNNMATLVPELKGWDTLLNQLREVAA